MGYLGSLRTAILGELSSANTSLAHLYSKTLGDLTPDALNSDSASFSSLDSALTSLEGPRINKASAVNRALGQYYTLLRRVEVSGGLNVNSPIHSQVTPIVQALHSADSNFGQALLLLSRATLAGYPGSLPLLSRAQAAIDRGTADLLTALGLASKLQLASPAHRSQMPVTLDREFSRLLAVRAEVNADPNLNSDERAGLLQEINGELAALGQVSRCVAISHSTSCLTAFESLLGQGAFVLLRTKVDIVLAGAADRAAISVLNSMLPTLRSRITAASKHRDVTSLQAAMNLLVGQLAAAIADIAPIDSEFLPMTATTAAQRGADLMLVRRTMLALTDANSALTAAKNNANQILAGTV
jgi:hypothetical protein